MIGMLAKPLDFKPVFGPRWNEEEIGDDTNDAVGALER